jgi:hypothetical protein
MRIYVDERTKQEQLCALWRLEGRYPPDEDTFHDFLEDRGFIESAAFSVPLAVGALIGRWPVDLRTAAFLMRNGKPAGLLVAIAWPSVNPRPSGIEPDIEALNQTDIGCRISRIQDGPVFGFSFYLLEF